jgi:predicted nucleic acid-binding Zn ribbon protein
MNWMIRKSKILFKKEKEQKRCVVCGKEFKTNRWKQSTCLSEECQKIMKVKLKREWFFKNKHKINQKRSKNIRELICFI